MAKWTHLIRFLAREDGQVHLGQLVDPRRDPGLDSFNGTELKAYLINGDLHNGEVTEHVLTVERVSLLIHALRRDFWTNQRSFFRQLQESNVHTLDASV